jgi:hypothetical protein
MHRKEEQNDVNKKRKVFKTIDLFADWDPAVISAWLLFCSGE